MPGLDALPPAIRSLRPVKTLEANLREGRLAHAILLNGDDLVLLRDVAGALAASLLGPAGDPASHPDLFTLRPARKARSIIVGKRGHEEPNTMRGLVRDLNQTANRGGWKVAIVHEADRMNAAAANAFLKTLEEPPPQTLILLLSTRAYDVIETIRSRCFQFKIPSSFRSRENALWEQWQKDYRGWIRLLHADPQRARRRPDHTLLEAYGLITRFVSTIAEAAEYSWKEQEASLPPSMSDEEVEALKTGLQKGVRDRLLIDIEESTRLAAIELSHEVPFPATQLTRAIAALESSTGLLALNMKDDAALESFFLQSLRIWTGK
ncbi:MAG: hypothetical protein R6V45_12945 [Oceanipulchritudo sp.]